MLKLVIENNMSFFGSSLIKSKTMTTVFLDDGLAGEGEVAHVVNKEDKMFEAWSLYTRVKLKLHSLFLKNNLCFEDMIQSIIASNRSILYLKPDSEYRLYALLGEHIAKVEGGLMFVEYVEIARGTICDFKQYLDEEFNERNPLWRLNKRFYLMSQFTPCDNVLDSLTQHILDIRKKSKSNEFEEIVNTLRQLGAELAKLKTKTLI